MDSNTQVSRIPYGHHWLDTDDIQAVAKALTADRITQGEVVGEFEEALANYCESRYAVVVSSGTAALHLACLALGLKQDDGVLVPTLSFVATANAVLYCGAIPVLGDIDPDTLCLRNTDNRFLKAVLPVDFAGILHSMETDVPMITDACHSLGVRKENYGDMACFSFHPVKAITTGEGGAIITDSSYLYEELKELRAHGRRNGQMYSLGYNYRITDFQCALGMSQLKKLDFFIKRRREIAGMYNTAFGLPSVKNHAYHIYVLKLPNEGTRDRLWEHCHSKGIDVQLHYKPIHLQPYYMERFGYKEGDFPVAEDYAKRALTLPCYPKMSDKDVEYVIDVVKECL